MCSLARECLRQSCSQYHSAAVHALLLLGLMEVLVQQTLGSEGARQAKQHHLRHVNSWYINTHTHTHTHTYQAKQHHLRHVRVARVRGIARQSLSRHTCSHHRNRIAGGVVSGAERVLFIWTSCASTSSVTRGGSRGLRECCLSTSSLSIYFFCHPGGSSGAEVMI